MVRWEQKWQASLPDTAAVTATYGHLIAERTEWRMSSPFFPCQIFHNYFCIQFPLNPLTLSLSP